MRRSLRREILPGAPIWTKKAMWYYENVFGQQWMADIIDHKLYLTVSTYNWETVIFTSDQIQHMQGKRLPEHMFLGKWRIRPEEYAWIISIFMTAEEKLANKKTG